MNICNLRRFFFFAVTLVLTACGGERTIPDGAYKADNDSGESLVVSNMVVTLTYQIDGKPHSQKANLHVSKSGDVYVTGVTSASYPAILSRRRQCKWVGDHFTALTWEGKSMSYRR